MSAENQKPVSPTQAKKIKTLTSFGFWMKIKVLLGSLGIGTEVALHFGDSEMIWKYITGAATVIGIIITLFFEDKDSDGVVDLFEK